MTGVQTCALPICYFIDGFDFDLKKFPHLENGFYSFASSQKLVEALPHNILESDHKFDFNCFDSVAILAFERLQPNIHIDDISGPYLVTSPMITNGQSAILCATTPREAFNLGYTITYREVTERLMPKSMQDARICLTASLSRYYKLPPSTVQETLRTDTLDVLRSAWLRDGLKFSNQFEVVLCHGISLVDRSICTAHAGLLFHRQKGYSYIEKAGPYGPFVRLDFTDRVDLKPWLAAMFSRLVAQTSYYVTFNDTKIEKLVPAQ